MTGKEAMTAGTAAAHRRDFYSYLRWRRLFRTFLPWQSVKHERGGGDTIRAFVELDSTGRTAIRPRHPRVLRAAEEGKKLLNWQIKQWAEGSADPCVTIPAELRAEYPWLPEWVWSALRRQSFGFTAGRSP